LPDVVPPLAYVASAAGLAVVLLVAVATVARTQAVTLRPYLSGLVALGLPRRWAKQVLYREMGVLLALGATFGSLVALFPLTLATTVVEGLRLAVPWSQVSLFLTVATLATVQSSRRLRSSERGAAA
jgi:hypothetical protein